MSIELETLLTNVRLQKDLIPSLYGDVNFSIVPERFAGSVDDSSMLSGRYLKRRNKLLQDIDRVERYWAYTMLGDSVSDAYAALMPRYGFKKLIELLTQACDKGIDSIPNPPEELVHFIAEMEIVPAWLNRHWVEQGARMTRIQMAVAVPFFVSGVFVPTITNRYSGLAMSVTGTMADSDPTLRMQELSSFLTTACLPGALQRHGAGFKAAAMVRLTHSLARFNLLKRPDKWNINVYGIPIPLIDQIPAGMGPALLVADKAIRRRGKAFTQAERAIVEFCRYQCFLIGLPEALLPDTPDGILDVVSSYFATLRNEHDENDDATGKTPAHSRQKRMTHAMSITPLISDYLKMGLNNSWLFPQRLLHMMAFHIPVLEKMSDRYLVRKINTYLSGVCS